MSCQFGERLIARRTKAARFREAKRLEDFDWQFNCSIERKQIFDLATGAFVRQASLSLRRRAPARSKVAPCSVLLAEFSLRE